MAQHPVLCQRPVHLCLWSTDGLEKLLQGPWTDEKLKLVHSIAGLGLHVESQSAAAVKGMNDATVEHNPQAIESLNPRGHFGVTREIF